MIPFPYDAVAGAINDPAESEASNLTDQLSWVARLSNEMNTETTLNLKKLFQLVAHMRNYSFWFNRLAARLANEGNVQDSDWTAIRPSGQTSQIVQGAFATKKMVVTLADLSALNTACNTLAGWIETNAADYKNGFTTSTVIGADSDNRPIVSDTAIVVAKPNALATRLSAFRAQFSG